MRNKLLILSVLMVVGLLGCSNEENDTVVPVVDQQQANVATPAANQGGQVLNQQSVQVPSNAVVVPQVQQQMPQTVPMTNLPPAEGISQGQAQPMAVAPIVEQQHVAGVDPSAAPANNQQPVMVQNPASSPIMTGSEMQTALPVDQNAGGANLPPQQQMMSAPIQQSQLVEATSSAAMPIAQPVVQQQASAQQQQVPAHQ